MRKTSTFFTAFAALCLLTTAGCWERNVETRAKLEKSRAKVNISEDLKEYGNYDKYRDKLFRERFFEKVETQRADRRRNRETNAAMKDGSLMEKYSSKRKGRDTL